MVQPTKSDPPGEYFWSTFEPLPPSARAEATTTRAGDRVPRSSAMRGLRRHADEPGLDDDRRTLIHRYMVDRAQQPDTVEQVIDLAVHEPEPPADPTPAPTSAPTVLDLVPPAPERREGGEVSVDVFRQTLEHVVRLSAQVAEAREECRSRRERLAAG